MPIRDQITSDLASTAHRADCEVSHWKRGPCNATCGDGFRVKTRTIQVSQHYKMTE